jgi:hypothetical protein
MSDLDAEARHLDRVARGMVACLKHLDGAEGCFALALAYAIWCESYQAMSRDDVDRMLTTSTRTTREAFIILRALRGAREAMNGAANGGKQHDDTPV